MIQTTLLVILYGKLCSTRYHHEMAHIFWVRDHSALVPTNCLSPRLQGSTLTMYRRSALFAPRGSHPPHELRNDPHAQWAAWVEDESAKRAAYTAFLIDVQHAAIFRHAPTLSAFQIQHVLPADEEEWTAPTAKAWQKLHLLSRPGVPFMSALKASLMPGLAPPFLNPFSRVVLLHGLISVAFDMQWRDVFMLGLAAPDGPVKDWRETISAAFNCWKSRLDSCRAYLVASCQGTQADIPWQSCHRPPLRINSFALLSRSTHLGISSSQLTCTSFRSMLGAFCALTRPYAAHTRLSQGTKSAWAGRRTAGHREHARPRLQVGTVQRRARVDMACRAFLAVELNPPQSIDGPAALSPLYLGMLVRHSAGLEERPLTPLSQHLRAHGLLVRSGAIRSTTTMGAFEHRSERRSCDGFPRRGTPSTQWRFT